jgi:hypothetical protein
MNDKNGFDIFDFYVERGFSFDKFLLDTNFKIISGGEKRTTYEKLIYDYYENKDVVVTITSYHTGGMYAYTTNVTLLTIAKDKQQVFEGMCPASSIAARILMSMLLPSEKTLKYYDKNLNENEYMNFQSGKQK